MTDESIWGKESEDDLWLVGMWIFVKCAFLGLFLFVEALNHFLGT